MYVCLAVINSVGISSRVTVFMIVTRIYLVCEYTPKYVHAKARLWMSWDSFKVGCFLLLFGFWETNLRSSGVVANAFTH